MTSTLTLAGLLLGGLIAGTVLIESIFAWPGMGMALVKSITEKDYPLAQTLVVIYGAIVLLINFIVDVVLALIDPRSQFGRTELSTSPTAPTAAPKTPPRRHWIVGTFRTPLGILALTFLTALIALVIFGPMIWVTPLSQPTRRHCLRDRVPSTSSAPTPAGVTSSPAR